MLKQPVTPRVSPTGLADRLRSQVLDSTEHGSDIEETESNQGEKFKEETDSTVNVDWKGKRK